MLADAIGHAGHIGRIAEHDRDAAACLERRPIELEPARGAALREPPRGDDNVGIGAGAGQLGPVDPVAAANRHHAPRGPALDNIGDARVTAAAGESLFLECEGIAVVGRCFAHQVAHEIAAATAQEDGHAVGADQGEMLPVAGDQQVGPGRHRRPHRAKRERHQPPAADATGPQAQP